MEISEFIKSQNKLRANLESAYTLLLGKCTEITQTHLQGLRKWETVNGALDAIDLLKIIKSLSHQSTEQRC